MKEKLLNIFISYSWDDEAHKEWVKNLADYLIEKGGCDVTIDQYDLVTGGNTMFFMEKAVNNADKVLLILTPNYKVKADGRQGGVGAEYSMISQGLYAMQENNTKFLPILRKGSLDLSAPIYVQTTIYHDMSNDLTFEKTAFDLLRVIHDKPKAVKPIRGAIPDFKETNKIEPNADLSDGFASSATKILIARQLKKEIKELYSSPLGVQLVMESTLRIFNSIERQSESYSREMRFSFYVERINNNSSIRVQVEDYYVVLDYGGYPYNSVRLIKLDIRSGKDMFYNPLTGLENRSLVNIIASEWNSNRDESFYPEFDDSKNVIWTQNRIKHSEKGYSFYGI